MESRDYYQFTECRKDYRDFTTIQDLFLKSSSSR